MLSALRRVRHSALLCFALRGAASLVAAPALPRASSERLLVARLRNMTSGGVRQVSLDSLSDAHGAGGDLPVSFAERMFGVDKTVAIARHNLHRLDALWGTVTAHLYQIATHPRPAMRQHGMKAYAALIVDGFRYTYGTEKKRQRERGAGGSGQKEGKKGKKEGEAALLERQLMG
eukprot:1796620-Rhodomonas_salina.1